MSRSSRSTSTNRSVTVASCRTALESASPPTSTRTVSRAPEAAPAAGPRPRNASAALAGAAVAVLRMACSASTATNDTVSVPALTPPAACSGTCCDTTLRPSRSIFRRFT